MKLFRMQTLKLPCLKFVQEILTQVRYVSTTLHFPFMHDDEASFSKLKGLSLAISTAVLSQEIKAITLHLILSGSPMNFCFSCTRC